VGTASCTSAVVLPLPYSRAPSTYWRLPERGADTRRLPWRVAIVRPQSSREKNRSQVWRPLVDALCVARLAASPRPGSIRASDVRRIESDRAGERPSLHLRCVYQGAKQRSDRGHLWLIQPTRSLLREFQTDPRGCLVRLHGRVTVKSCPGVSNTTMKRPYRHRLRLYCGADIVLEMQDTCFTTRYN